MSEEIFKPSNESVSEIFGNVKALYKMPIYQRPYAWDKERVEQLWYDILEAYKNNTTDENFDKNYFLGSVVVVDKGEYQDVVDGQQRLTTLTILFCVLRDLEVFSEDTNEYDFVNDSIKKNGKKPRLTLRTHSANQAGFEEEIIKGLDFERLKKNSESNRFLQTAYYFKNLIENAQNLSDENYIEDFQGFINYLFTKTTMIKIICSDENFAIKLFSVLNDRGLNLTPADVIKAYLMESLADDETKLNSFVEVWKQIESEIVDTDEKIEGILNLYLYFLTAKNPKKSLQDELKSQFKNLDSQETILNILKFAKKYKEAVSDKDSCIYMLRYIPHSIYWKSILTTARHEEYSNYIDLRKIITQYFYKSWIAGGTSNRVKQTSFTILKMVKESKNLDDIKKLMDENLTKYDHYGDYLKKPNVYSERWLKPLLLSVEYFVGDREKDFIPIVRSLHVEHILPKTWDAEKSWDGVLLNWKDIFSKEDADNLKNSIGNLTLLSGKKNIEASNCNYHKKIDIYKGNSGKGFDGITSFEITKQVIDRWGDTWNKDNINSRCEDIVSKVKNILEK